MCTTALNFSSNPKQVYYINSQAHFNYKIYSLKRFTNRHLCYQWKNRQVTYDKDWLHNQV